MLPKIPGLGNIGLPDIHYLPMRGREQSSQITGLLDGAAKLKVKAQRAPDKSEEQPKKTDDGN
ncbi:hypothetical protein [Pararhizobium sp. DWP3-4]|uniref:hypothetical protein n=1 Tax=Pararhizobium sp. DWP3-4 TaxID=2804565 RepID=UPI003CEDA557